MTGQHVTEPKRIVFEFVVSDRVAATLAAAASEIVPILMRLSIALGPQAAEPAPIPCSAPAPPPRTEEPTPPSPNASRVWTDRRLELLRERFQTGGDHLQLLTILNAQPGREIVAAEAMLIKARDLGLGDDVASAPALFRPRPPVETPTPEKMPAGHIQQIKWTPERVLLLATMRAAGEKWDAIHASVNALPGDPIASAASTEVKWHHLVRKNQLPAVEPKAARIPPVKPSVPPEARVATPPAPVTTAPSAPQRILSFSDERKAVLKRMWERGEPVPSIRANLNTMAGPKLSDQHVLARAAILNLRRPQTAVRGEHDVPATGADVRNWLREAGGDPATYQTDEAACAAANAIRDRLQLPVFFLTDDVFDGNLDFCSLRGVA